MTYEEGQQLLRLLREILSQLKIITNGTAQEQVEGQG